MGKVRTDSPEASGLSMDEEALVVLLRTAGSRVAAAHSNRPLRCLSRYTVSPYLAGRSLFRFPRFERRHGENASDLY